MQSLQYATSGTQTIAVWPDVTSSLAGNPSASFDMVLVNDYGQQLTTVDLTLQNIPTSVTPRLVFALNKAQLPPFTGNYTITVKETLSSSLIWGFTNITWGNIQAEYGDSNFGGNPIILDIDRAWVSGSDEPSFIQYTSPDETGAYSIYHG